MTTLNDVDARFSDALRDCQNIRELEREAQRSLSALRMAMSDDSHYYVNSLNHYTKWLIEQGLLDKNHVGAYLDEMRPKTLHIRLMRKARKRLEAVTGLPRSQT